VSDLKIKLIKWYATVLILNCRPAGGGVANFSCCHLNKCHVAAPLIKTKCFRARGNFSSAWFADAN